MSGEITAARITKAEIRYANHKLEYTAIFGEDAVWCRPIPHIKAVSVIVKDKI
jgi:hypothetical protein